MEVFNSVISAISAIIKAANEISANHRQYIELADRTTPLVITVQNILIIPYDIRFYPS
jgi:hypothetical protein